jgi:hypothetical protein
MSMIRWRGFHRLLLTKMTPKRLYKSLSSRSNTFMIFSFLQQARLSIQDLLAAKDQFQGSNKILVKKINICRICSILNNNSNNNNNSYCNRSLFSKEIKFHFHLLIPITHHFRTKIIVEGTCSEETQTHSTKSDKLDKYNNQIVIELAKSMQIFLRQAILLMVSNLLTFKDSNKKLTIS